MSLSDCPECWSTPCTCGHMGYRVVWPQDPEFAAVEARQKAADTRTMDRLREDTAIENYGDRVRLEQWHGDRDREGRLI